MWRDDRQLADVCRTLLKSARLGDLWTDEAPTPQARTYYDAGGGPLSSGERVLVLFAFALWNGENTRLPAADLLKLSGVRLALVGELLAAIARGDDAIDRWLSTVRGRIDLNGGSLGS
jgi:hypothetical protein